MLSRGSAKGFYRDTEYWLNQKILTEMIPETGKNLLSKLIQVSMIFLDGYAIVCEEDESSVYGWKMRE